MKHLILLVLIVIATALFYKHYKFSRFDSSNTYCPSNYELINGDGTFTHDYSRPLKLSKIKVTAKEDWYIYDDKGNAFAFQDCIIREK